MEILCYYILMIKILKSSQKKVLLLSICMLSLILLVAGLVYIQGVQVGSRSNENKALMKRALDNLDPSICNQIEGNILESKPASHSSQIVESIATYTPAMTEAEAKSECKRDIKLATERQKS